MNNLSNVNFEKINDIVYANEENVVKELLEYLTPEYNSKLNNIKDYIQLENDGQMISTKLMSMI